MIKKSIIISLYSSLTPSHFVYFMRLLQLAQTMTSASLNRGTPRSGRRAAPSCGEDFGRVGVPDQAVFSGLRGRKGLVRGDCGATKSISIEV